MTQDCVIQEAKAACSTASQAESLQREHGNIIWDLEMQVIQEEVRSQVDFLSACQAALYASPLELKSALVASYHILLGQTPPFILLQRASQWGNSLLQLLLPHQCPSSLLGPKDDMPPQILWRACPWVEPPQRWLWEGPQFQVARTPTLEQSTQAKLHRGIWPGLWLGKEARREFFLKHSYNFITEGTCDLSGIFRQMATSANLLGTSIYEIQVSWTGPDELKQANYALRYLPKGLKFLHVVPPSESPKVMGLVGIHDADTLCCFSGITHCPWCGKEGQNEGTMVNHLQTVHYRLGLVCNKCHDCPSTMADTLHCHGWQDCCQPRQKNPNMSVSSE